MRRLFLLFFFCAALLLAAADRVLAVEPDEVLADPALEARARALSKELRCMVCQNQSIDESDAPLARDLRLLLRERLKAGDTDRQVTAFLVARYGEFVLLRPAFSAHTALLWLGPAMLAAVGILVLLVFARRYRAAGRAREPTGLTAGEQAQLAKILERDSP